MTDRTKLLVDGTPLEDHTEQFKCWVKREDLSARKPGPAFSKTRGVYAHLANLPPDVRVVGVLDTYHSQAGHAVAHAAQALGIHVINYYPEYKREPGHRAPQDRAAELGASLVGLPAGRSAVLFHQAKKDLKERIPVGSYMMPNALKLPEMVEETAREVQTLPEAFQPTDVIIPISSGTIAAGVIRGFLDRRCSVTGEPITLPMFHLHMGYSRSMDAVRKYVDEKVGESAAFVALVDQGYGYKDKARPGVTPPWPCSPYYDLKALRYHVDSGMGDNPHTTLFWNIG